MTRDSNLEHIIRPQLPWRREGAKTECGRAADSNAITFDEFREKFKREGQQRSALTTCMTCWNRATIGARLREDWAHHPYAVIAREQPGWGETDTLIDRELRTLAALAEAHRDEFDEFLSGLASTISLSDAHAKRKGKARS